MMNGIKYASIGETAKITGISKYYLRKLKGGGGLPGFSSGRKWYVDINALLLQLKGQGEVLDNGKKE